MQDLNLAHLHAFALVAELGSFSAAADRLGVSQPAISAQVKQLERRCGVRLLERVGRRAAPTPAGAELLRWRQAIDGAIEGALEAVAEYCTETRGQVRLGSGATAAIHLLPPVLGTLRRQFPELAVVVSTGNTADFIPAVESNAIDVALVTLPVPERGSLTVMPVAREDFVAVAPPGVLPDRGKATPRRLARLPLILFEPGANTRVLIDRWFRQAGLTPKPVMELGSVEAIKEMVAAGLGCSVLPAMAVTGKARRADLVVRPLAPGLGRELALALRKDKPLSKALNQVVQAITRHASTEGAPSRAAPP
jgi:DNA-binding transcriptional LysR family regulator